MKPDKMPSPKINPAQNPFHGPKAVLPARVIPSFNVKEAFDRGTQHNFLINTWGGLGDQICAEPAIRFALKAFKQCRISLASTCPSLYSHLKFEKVYDTREESPNWKDYFTFQTILPPSHLLWEFCSHMLTHAVDFPSICMWRSTLPNAEKEIMLPDFPLTPKIEPALRFNEQTVVIHAGKHWQSKTFPKSYWEQVVFEFIRQNWRVVLIGQKVDENVGYVDVDPHGCVDLRDALSIPEFIALLKNCRYLFSNDSSPIHAAASGDAFIGFVATCKHPDYLMHWRKGQFGYRSKNFGLDGAWNHIDYSPVQKSEVKVEELPAGLMEKILPKPKDVVDFYSRMRREDRNDAA